MIRRCLIFGRRPLINRGYHCKRVASGLGAIRNMGSNVPTIAVFLKDETLRLHTTKVVSVQNVSTLSEVDRSLFKQANEIEDMIVITTETVFYAQGGGQPSDSGSMQCHSTINDTVFEVSSVRRASSGQILHLGRFTFSSQTTGKSTAPASFEAGSIVTQIIDWDKRVLNSRIHTGGHIVGLAVRHLQATIPDVLELKAQHYPDLAFVDFKGTIEGKHRDAIQGQVDEFVQRALPIKVYWWNEAELREKCAVVPEAVAIPAGELVRAVDIVGAGAYPCGGTHVSDTGKVGQIKIKKISRSKGNSKISYSIY